MLSNSFEMKILVGGKPIEEYYHDGQYYIEGRNGSEYSIRLTNRSGRRACFVVSVDGLSVINGEEASENSTGYVVNTGQTLDLSCYKVDDTTGARFEFGSKEKSYSAEIGHGTTNVGVIAAMVFLEKHRPFVMHQYCWPKSPVTRYTKSSKPVPYSSGISTSFSAQSMGIGNLPQNASDIRSATRVYASGSEDPSFEDQQLGTSFGQSMEWKTTNVSFEREAASSAVMMFYYDSRKNLERRGIEFKKKVPPLPNPFPASGCPTPQGWRK
jgi:hypothetical protein